MEDESGEAKQEGSHLSHKPKKDDNDDAPMDLDEVLPAVGEFGRYQKLLLWLVCLPACVPCGFCAFNQLFMADVPEQIWCKVPELVNAYPPLPPEVRRLLVAPPVNNRPYLNPMLSTEQRKISIGSSETSVSTTSHPNDVLPSSTIAPSSETLELSSCLRYNVNFTREAEAAGIPLLNLRPSSKWPKATCRSDWGWEYNSETIYSSIVIDFDLVCDQAIYPTIGLAALNAGGPIGVYLFGLLNDRVGRRISFFSCLATLLFGGILTAFAPDFWSWAACRFIVGLTIPAVYQIPFIICEPPSSSVSNALYGPIYKIYSIVLFLVEYNSLRKHYQSAVK